METDKAQIVPPEKARSCPDCEGKGYLMPGYLYCHACWGTGNGNLDKKTADRRALDYRWASRVTRLAAEDRPWDR